MQLDVLTVGNAVVDAFLTIHDANEYIHLDKERNEFRLSAGEKIQLESCVFEVGGNACNLAVGLSRLGFTTGLMAEIGEDELAEKIMRRLHSEDVATTFVKQKGQSSFAMGLNFRGERTQFVEHVDREHLFSFHTVVTHAIYLTSIGHKWHHVYQMVRDFVKKHDTFLALSPGTKQLKEGAGFLRELLPYANLLFLNKEEGLRLIGQENGRKDLKALFHDLHLLGAHTVVITDGKKGSYASDGLGHIYHAPIHDAPVVERTGAGDAYATGFMGAILSGRDLTEAMRWGSLSAAGVVGKVGAQPGLLTRHEMAEQLESSHEVVKEV